MAANEDNLVKRIIRKLLGTSGQGVGAATEKIKKKRKKEKELLEKT